MIRRNRKSPVTLKIVGMFLSEGYQNCKLFVQRLRKHHKDYFREPVIKGFLEVDWIQYLSTLQRTVGGQTWAIKKGVVVFIDDIFIGGDKELFSHYRPTYQHKKLSAEAIKRLAKQEYLEYLNKKNLLYTYMELSLDGSFFGTLLFELQVDLLPKTSSRFAFLCDPENYTGQSYKGSLLFRVCKGGWFQAGRLTKTTATLEDETFSYSHDSRGVISFANQDKESTTNEFFVTFSPSRWMDRHFVAFGRVVEGWDLLGKIENMPCRYESPVGKISISDCGLADAGFGRKMVTKLRMKGLTVGEPHIDLETFKDLILDCFTEGLFGRLDQEVRRQLNTEWMATMIWENIEPSLRMRQPVDDFPDVRDIPSKEYVYDRYLSRIKGPLDVSNHGIRSILEKIVNESLDEHEVITIAKNIVASILNLLEHKKERELIAKNFIKKLISDVNLIINSEKGILSEKSVSKILSSILSKSLSSKMTFSDSAGGKETIESKSTKDENELIAQSLINKLISDLNLIIYNAEKGISREKSVSKVLSSILSKGLSSKMSVPNPTREKETIESKSIKDNLSESGVSDQSLAGYIRSMLFKEMNINGN